MIKLIYMTDTHGRATSPTSRLDNFPLVLLDKLKWVGEYAKEIKANGVLHGGDWLESPDVSEGYIGDMAKVLKEYPCPIFSIIGNHDIYGYNPDTFKRTGLGIAQVSGIFTRLYRDFPVFIEGETESVCLTGQDAIYDLDKNGNDFYYTDTPSNEYYFDKPCTDIHIVHGMLVEKDWPMVSCTVIDKIKDECAADIILTGHEHTGFSIKTCENTTFCNPGSLSRVTASVGDVRKDVRIAVITIVGSSYNIELVNLPDHIAKSANLVIDRDKLIQEKSAKENLNKFIENITKGKVAKTSDVYDAADALGEELGLDKEVIEKSKSALRKAEEELKDSNNEDK